MTDTTIADTTILNFTAAASGGPFKLSAHKGKPVVLYFYPKDNTPGCTTESQDFRDLHNELTKAGAVVFGISRDSVKSHDGFREKQELPFHLISDTDEKVCSQFGVMKMKNMYGKQVRGIERSTFVIGRDGNLAKEWRGVKVPGHAQAVLDFVKTL